MMEMMSFARKIQNGGAWDFRYTAKENDQGGWDLYFRGERFGEAPDRHEAEIQFDLHAEMEDGLI